MIGSRRLLILALLFPILALAALTAYKGYIYLSGQEVTLPISGYDPRDLLSGHYLIYTIDYGVSGLCEGMPNRHSQEQNFESNEQPGFVCLSSKQFSWNESEDCDQMIAGQCTGLQFRAGIERFYVPQHLALPLERKIQSKSASIVLSVSRTGRAQVKDLLIDGQSWKDISLEGRQ